MAVQLRRRGFDVVAATEPDWARRYRGVPDEEVFRRAQEDRYALVTDNIGDFAGSSPTTRRAAASIMVSSSLCGRGSIATSQASSG
ncbi:MAG: DUF5615 family PIN-like protein [Egibacteraceae bacterium]